jgi:hypothetical protein
MRAHPLLAAVVFLISPWGRTLATPARVPALDATDGFPDQGPPGRRLAALQIPRNGRIICGGAEAEILLATKIATSPMPADCSSRVEMCYCSPPKLDDREGIIYVLRDAAGRPIGVEQCPLYSPFSGLPYPGKPGTATIDQLRMVSKKKLRPWLDNETPPPTSTCFELPEEIAADTTHTLVLSSTNARGSIVELVPSRTIKPPKVPPLAPVNFWIPREWHQDGDALRFEPLSNPEGLVFLWHLEKSGGDHLFGPRFSRAPTLPTKGYYRNPSLDENGRYVLVVSAVNLLGQTSEPVRIPFTVDLIPASLGFRSRGKAPNETPKLTHGTSIPDEPVVFDTANKRTWQGCIAGRSGKDCKTVVNLKNCLRGDENGAAFTWAQARSYCEGLTWGGKNDWYLPDRNQLAGLLDDNEANPSDPNIDLQLFPSTPASRFWSSTGAADQVWILNFAYGYRDAYLSKSHATYVRCVRDGL